MYYTKYRPQKFSEISKPNDTAVALMNQIKSGKTSHAYLFVGPRGTGKTTTARILAKSLNCEKPSADGNPCLKCSSCMSIAAGSYIDLIEIDAASNRGIDDIRELKDKIRLSPSAGSTKVYIIDEVHMLTPEAFNALLKTLEEPPVHAVFILCTTELHKVPDTIKSRCQLYKFKRATKVQLVERLQAICESEGVDRLTKEDLGKIAEASFGGFRDAETVLQQVVEGNLDPTSFVGLSSKQVYIDFVDSLLKGDSKEALYTISKVSDDGIDLNVWCFGLLNYLRDLLFVKISAHGSSIDVSDELLESIQAQSKESTVVFLSNTLHKFLEASSEINGAVIPQLPLELAVVDICSGLGLTNNTTITENTDPLDSSAIKSNTKTESPTKGKSTANLKSKSSESIKVTNSEDVLSEEEELSELAVMFADEEEIDDVVIVESISTESVSSESAPIVELVSIIENWSIVIKESVQFNNSIHALLKSCTPVEVVGNKLFLEVSYKFHKDRLESPKNRNIVEGVLKKVLGEDLDLYCRINADKRPKKKLSDKEVGELTDQNIAPAMLGNMENAEGVLNFFDGGLPM